MNFQHYITEGKGRSDLSLLFADPKAFGAAIEKMTDPFRSASVTKVVALDALGFVFGAPIAQSLGVGLALLRKEGKIPIPKKVIKFIDYTKTEKMFEVAADAIVPGDKILIVDEWSETGSQLKAAASLIEQCGGVVVGITCFNIDKAAREDEVLSKYRMNSLI